MLVYQLHDETAWVELISEHGWSLSLFRPRLLTSRYEEARRPSTRTHQLSFLLESCTGQILEAQYRCHILVTLLMRILLVPKLMSFLGYYNASTRAIP